MRMNHMGSVLVLGESDRLVVTSGNDNNFVPMGQKLSFSAPHLKHVPLSESRESLNFQTPLCPYCDRMLTGDPVCAVCHAYRIFALDYVRAFGCHCWEDVNSRKDLNAPVTHSCQQNGGNVMPNWKTPREVADEIYNLRRQATPVVQEKLPNNCVFPPEILSMIFRHLDEVSLIRASRVSSYWNSVVLVHFPEQFWETLFRRRWPLHNFTQPVESWLKLYAEMVDTVSCITCFLNATGEIPVPNFCGNPGTSRETRLEKELLSLKRVNIGSIEVTPADTAKYNWIARLEGPPASPYEGGVFYVNLKFPQNYPFQPPTCRFITKILHPNICRHGDVYLEVLDPKSWNPGRTLRTVINSILKAMLDPEILLHKDGSTVGDKLSSYVFTADKYRFNLLAKDWTKRYASNYYELQEKKT